jgi:predicted nucleic acid-binding protein
MSVGLHATYFDASALVKVFSNEPDSDAVRQYWRAQATKKTTLFCFYETLSVLKGKTKRKPPSLTKAEYLRTASDLFAWYNAAMRGIKDPEFTNPDVFAKAKKIAEDHDLDLSDSLQLVTLKDGYFSPLTSSSTSLLVTADESLAIAARAMGLPVWDCSREPMPAF